MTDRAMDVLIDEVVVGLAEDADVARLEALAAEDPVLAARLDVARAKFAALDATADELAVPQDLWARIDAELNSEPTATAPQPTPSAGVIDLSAVRAQVSRWRASALTGIAAALVMAILLGWNVLTPQDPAVVAILLDARGEAVAMVEGMPDNTTRVTLLERQDVPPDQVMQVWTKPRADGPPVSLGLLETGRSRTLTIQGLPTPNPQQLYEITAEPAGGSPTNLPTGPILGKGLAKAPVI
ncbi:anti-sigma factor domain-containing protein [Tropicibacter naphthalenivorans]|uniref:Putative anti-sigmaE protein n=1 Tax=Tropicibacter naphthalenivorans TaxID=441103 RepID=A0A0P1GGG5_9RHOB|nr:anti-sigma factor [Tropicibacter naphthalenivorans]CUH80710.1 putative anti-sigmaE protein [Tropicibacter naphthalenivorans]SMC89460.1 Anti-sigma-K factor RskA [Tropicibacter naphthalenivorans]